MNQVFFANTRSVRGADGPRKRGPHQVDVTIGLPVFNGENFIREAIESILAQSYENFELIISDNASIDGTETICRAFAARDPRIRYYRNPENRGASYNFNRLVRLARGRYFKWAAHDDTLAPEFLDRCVRVLNDNPDVVLCYTRTQAIDAQGKIIGDFSLNLDLSHPDPHVRFHRCLRPGHALVDIFGLIRTGALRRTLQIGNFSSSDRILEAELALQGRFHEVPEPLFFNRHHDGQHYRHHPKRRDKAVWYDPKRADRITFPNWRLLWEYFKSTIRLPLRFQHKWFCRLSLIWWMRRNWNWLLSDLIFRDFQIR